MKVTLELFGSKKEIEMQEHFIIQRPEKGDRFKVIGAELFNGIPFAIIYIDGKGCFDLPFTMLPNGYINKELMISDIEIIKGEHPPRRKYKIEFAE